jgi:lipoprotein-anchoring transpeptidase ErfK/SrfK
MRNKWFTLLAVLLLVIVGGAAAAAYAYDSSRDDMIAEGVTVSGVDVGGMRVAEARRAVAARLDEPLGRPITVARAGRRFTLSAKDAGVTADVAGMVDDALEQSRDGSIIDRVARDLGGGEESLRIPARVSYDEQAVAGLVTRVEKRMNRPAKDADVEFPSLERVESKRGLKVRAARLERQIGEVLAEPDAERRLRIPAKRIKPKVTTAQLEKKYPIVLIADRANFQLRLYEGLELSRSYTVAVGAVGFDTPAGLYHIQNKAVDPAWTVPNSDWAGSLAGTVVPGGVAENPLKARWLGIFDGAGIHGTDVTSSLGSAASHGCIRMAIPEVIELYDKVPVGAPIYIA